MSAIVIVLGLANFGEVFEIVLPESTNFIIHKVGGRIVDYLEGNGVVRSSLCAVVNVGNHLIMSASFARDNVLSLEYRHVESVAALNIIYINKSFQIIYVTFILIVRNC